MFNISQEMILIVIGGAISWLVVILGVAQLSRFYARFLDAKRSTESALVGLAGQTKRLETLLGELVREQRRACRLLGELGDLQKAQMTGEYEIVEEPIAPDSGNATAASGEAVVPAPAIPAPEPQGGKHFHGINL